MIAGSVASRSGLITAGDMLLAVNGIYLSSCTLSEAISLLQSSNEEIVTLRIQKIEPYSNMFETERLINNSKKLESNQDSHVSNNNTNNNTNLNRLKKSLSKQTSVNREDQDGSNMNEINTKTFNDKYVNMNTTHQISKSTFIEPSSSLSIDLKKFKELSNNTSYSNKKDKTMDWNKQKNDFLTMGGGLRSSSFYHNINSNSKNNSKSIPLFTNYHGK